MFPVTTGPTRAGASVHSRPMPPTVASLPILACAVALTGRVGAAAHDAPPHGDVSAEGGATALHHPGDTRRCSLVPPAW